MKNKLNILIKGVLAGISISLGGYIFIKSLIVSSNNILPSFLFSIGLMLVCTFGFYLYTGKICFVLEDKVVSDTNQVPNKIISLAIGLLGNLIGCFIFAMCVRIIDKDNNFYDRLSIIVDNKNNSLWYKTIISSIFCGFLVNMAVLGFKRCNSEFGKYLLVLICIGSFVLLGFDHCVANMFYYFTNFEFSWIIVLNLLLCILGNTIGGLIYPSLEIIMEKKK